MNGIVFGKDIRIFRNKKGISSRGLSKRLGRGEAYISQLEGGKIKNPDYDTCFKILQILDFQSDQIEQILFEQYSIKSTEREAADLAKAIRRTEKNTIDYNNEPITFRRTGINKVDYNNEQIAFDTTFYFDNFLSWFELPKEEYKYTNKKLYYAFDNLIELDSSTSEKVMPNIALLVESKADFYFLLAIIEKNITKIKIEDRHKVLNVILDLTSSAV